MNTHYLSILEGKNISKVMEEINCLRCDFRHIDNGNCTAVGGFCTAVPASNCALLRDYLDTGLTPEIVKETAKLAIWVHKNGLDKIKDWISADNDGRLLVMPCKSKDTL